MPESYVELLAWIKDTARLEAIEGLLEWDQETYMPPKGLAPRAEMIALAAALRHERRTNPLLGELLGRVSEDGDPVRATNIRETRRRYERARRIPAELVRELAHTTSLARDAWMRARADNNFAAFAPLLGKILELKRREAQALGYTGEPYDALLEDYEPGVTTAQIAALFAELRQALVPVVQAIVSAPRQPDFSILTRHYPRSGQEQVAREVAKDMGFDFEAGRLDVSVHPFCQSMTGQDVRMTTRYDENYLPAALFGVMHEAGHALYEQGLDAGHAFTPMGCAASLGIHESQSRLWENQVGRSLPFWERRYARLQAQFPQALATVPLAEFHRAVNTVRPSCIRVEADEVTYNLHIILRFELERDLLNGRVAVADIPGEWNRRMVELVGIRPPTDREGCLQDIHWSMGAFGYFPTYTLGNLCAAQFFAAARRALSDLDHRIRSGDLGVLRDWLRGNIHRQGMRYRGPELVQVVTGQALAIGPFMDYVKTKFPPIYGLT